MRSLLAVLCFVAAGCVQIDDGTVVPPVPDAVVPDVTPDGGGSGNIDQAFLSKILADTNLKKADCMRYAALYQGFAQSFRERTDVPAMVLLAACFKTSDQFIPAGNAVIAERLKAIEQVDKSRETLAAEFDRMSATLRAAAAKK